MVGAAENTSTGAKPRRIGLWLIGAFGGVGTTVAVGLAAWRKHLIAPTGLVTMLPLFEGLDLDDPGTFILGGHEIRQTDWLQAAREMHQRAGIFPSDWLNLCREDLERWSANVRVGTLHNVGDTIARLADRKDLPSAELPRLAWERIQMDLLRFREVHGLDQVVVINVASTEPPFDLSEAHQDWQRFADQLSGRAAAPLLPASSIYALATIELGWPYVNFTPSLGASFPAAWQRAEERGAAIAGQDGKTGETLLKTVLAPMFKQRHLRVLSWVGHNIFGNRDGLVLDDPRNKESKIRTKDQVLASILGYKPQTLVSIEYIESLDDWKTAWDHIHFEGFLGVKMVMQFIWQGCDSVLAAPLVIDLARLALLAQRRGERGILRHLACFFKNPLDVQEHDFYRQYLLLEQYVEKLRPCGAGGPRGNFRAND
ncbi:MAG: inositol-3-phosphate synthase [Gemmatales bacterium]|nr:inositol-3-phosphate synthase [Gemmatales bacterium]MDW8222460.1 inositol-3-phosphate synthase [Gemmatales bacterium]